LLFRKAEAITDVLEVYWSEMDYLNLFSPSLINSPVTQKSNLCLNSKQKI